MALRTSQTLRSCPAPAALTGSPSAIQDPSVCLGASGTLELSSNPLLLSQPPAPRNLGPGCVVSGVHANLGPWGQGCVLWPSRGVRSTAQAGPGGVPTPMLPGQSLDYQ